MNFLLISGHYYRFSDVNLKNGHIRVPAAFSGPDGLKYVAEMAANRGPLYCRFNPGKIAVFWQKKFKSGIF